MFYQAESFKKQITANITKNKLWFCVVTYKNASAACLKNDTAKGLIYHQKQEK